MVSQLGQLLSQTGPASPPALLERARRPGRSIGSLARSLEDFFVDTGLAFPLDHAAQRSADRQRKRVEETPEPLRPAVARFADALTTGQQRARRAGTRPRGDLTIVEDLAIVRDLARFVVTQRAKTDWATVGAGDIEAFLALRPRSRARRRSVAKLFFRWAKKNRAVLVDPTTKLPAGRDRSFRGRTLTLSEQRRLFRHWTTDPDAHPNECLIGLLAMLHAVSSAQLRNLKVTDIDPGRRTIKLTRRRHPVPLDPVTWKAVQRCC
jgi:site-specific recombinase XerC